MTYDLKTGTNENQDKAIVLMVCFEVALFGVLALPVFADSPSVLELDGGQAGPMLVVAGVVVGAAIFGRRSPFMAGLAAGIVALISIALTLAVTIGLFLTILLGEFSDGLEWSGGALAVVAAAALGLTAVVVSARGWKPVSPAAWTPVAVLGAMAVVAMVVGLVVPDENLTFGDTLGFTAHPIIGFGFSAFLAMLAGVGVAGFALGRWGVGLLAGFLGYIAIGWLTSQSADQSEAFAWSGVDGSSDFTELTAIGFWAACGLFVIHAIQQFSVDSSPRSSAQSRIRPHNPHVAAAAATGSEVNGTWTADPFGRFDRRYFDGAQWTKHVVTGLDQDVDDPVHWPPQISERAWHPDPFGRFTHRFFDGHLWTDKVAKDGVTAVDAPVEDRPTEVPEAARAAPERSPRAGGGELSETVSSVESVSVSETLPKPSASTGPSLAPSAVDETVRRGEIVVQPSSSFVLTSDSGAVHRFVTAVAIGRSPSAPDGYPSALPLPVDDRTVSKTHIVLGRTGDQLWIVDLYSSNGTEVEGEAGLIRAVPGQRIVIPPGTRLVLGDATAFLVEMD